MCVNGVKFLVKDNNLYVIEAYNYKNSGSINKTVIEVDLGTMENIYVLYRLIDCLRKGQSVKEDEADSINFWI